MPLSRPAPAAIREWLADRAAHHSRPDVAAGPLWISRTGEQISVRSISKLVSSVMSRAGVEDSAHALRHTVATRLAREHGRDLTLVADILGHADLKTTRHHVRSDLEDRALLSKTWPRSCAAVQTRDCSPPVGEPGASCAQIPI